MVSSSPAAWCPVRTHAPARLLAHKGAGYRCPACGTHFPARLVHARPLLFAEPDPLAPPGYDPVTGDESQDLP